MFRSTTTAAVLTLAFGLATSAAQAQPGGYAQPAGYSLPGGFTQPAGYNYPTPLPAPMPNVVLEPPVRLGFQWAMCDYGMNVSALRAGGLAQQVGLLPGDIIVQMNNFPITGWNEYCIAMQDVMYNRAGQVEMWLYRPSPAGYELQYVAFTIHEEQVVVVVPCCYHEVKCHSHYVGCWIDRLVYLNHHWKQHCHDGHDGHDDHHHGLNLKFLGKGGNFNFQQFNHGGVNLGNLIDKHGHKNSGGQFGNFKFNDMKSQIKTFDKNNFNFDKHFKSNSNSHGSHGSNFNNHGKSFSKSPSGGNSMKNLSSQFSRGMKSFGGSGKK